MMNIRCLSLNVHLYYEGLPFDCAVCMCGKQAEWCGAPINSLPSFSEIGKV